jgi:hypothetical protein
LFGLVLSCLIERDVDPTTELARLIPDGLAVSDKDYLVSSLLFDKWIGSSLP